MKTADSSQLIVAVKFCLAHSIIVFDIQAVVILLSRFNHLIVAFRD